MLYTASYFEPQNHHGELINISRSRPKNFQNIPTLEFFAPSQDLLNFWKDRSKTAAPEELGKYWEEYQSGFSDLLCDRVDTIDRWLSALNPTRDYTLLCWEKAGDYCHRNDVGELLAARVPGLWGGFDVLVGYEKDMWVKSVHNGVIGKIIDAKYIGERLCYRVQCNKPIKFVTWLFAKDMVPSAEPTKPKAVKQPKVEVVEKEAEFVQLSLV